MITKLIIGAIVLHIVVAVVWLGIKLMPRNGDELIDSYEQEMKRNIENQ